MKLVIVLVLSFSCTYLLMVGAVLRRRRERYVFDGTKKLTTQYLTRHSWQLLSTYPPSRNVSCLVMFNQTQLGFYYSDTQKFDNRHKVYRKGGRTTNIQQKVSTGLIMSKLVRRLLRFYQAWSMPTFGL